MSAPMKARFTPAIAGALEGVAHRLAPVLVVPVDEHERVAKQVIRSQVDIDVRRVRDVIAPLLEIAQ